MDWVRGGERFEGPKRRGLWVRGRAWQIACFGTDTGRRSQNPGLMVPRLGVAGVSSSQENGKVWSVASTVRFRVDRKDDGGIVICEAQNQALPSGHSKQTQYVLDVQCKCPAGRKPAGLRGSQRQPLDPGKVPRHA